MVKYTALLIIAFCTFGCSVPENDIRELISEYESASNEYDKSKLKSLFIDPSILEISFALTDSLRDNGLLPKNKISISKIISNTDYAEAILQVESQYEGESKTIEALRLFTPPVIEMKAKMRKNNGKWMFITIDTTQQ